jgi:hypothetical protein
VTERAFPVFAFDEIMNADKWQYEDHYDKNQ